MSKTNLGKKYRDRHADERLLVYNLKRVSDKVFGRILRKVGRTK